MAALHESEPTTSNQQGTKTVRCNNVTSKLASNTLALCSQKTLGNQTIRKNRENPSFYLVIQTRNKGYMAFLKSKAGILQLEAPWKKNKPTTTSPLLVSHIMFVRFRTVHSSLTVSTSRPWQCAIERKAANYEPCCECSKGRSRELASSISAVTAVQQRRISQLCSTSPHNEPQIKLRANKANPTPRRCRATLEIHAATHGAPSHATQSRRGIVWNGSLHLPRSIVS